jgi:exodeoxyribonuclease III
MKVASWNINGIRACAKNGFEDWISTKPADVICLQEVRAELEQIPSGITSNSHFCHQQWNAAERKGYSGVGILSHTKPDEVICGLDRPEFDCEGRVLSAVFNGFTVVTAYFPNSQSAGGRLDYKVRFCERIHQFVDELESKYRQPVILNGDFNIAHTEIDLARPKDNEETAGYLPRERAWLDRFIASGWVDSFRKTYPDATEQYSWWSARQNARPRNIGWRIDYNTVSPSGSGMIKGAGIWQEVMGSDHCPVWIELG